MATIVRVCVQFALDVFEGHVGRLSCADSVAYMDSKGAVWGQNHVVDPEPIRVAPNGDALVARTVLWDMEWEHQLAQRRCCLEGKHGARLARQLELCVVGKASDPTWRAWADAQHVVIQTIDSQSGAPRTVVAGPDAPSLG